MSARTSILLRPDVPATVAATGEFYWPTPTVDVWLHRQRHGLTVAWELTAGEHGQVLTSGHAWTQGFAFLDGSAASHRKDLFSEWVGGEPA